MNNDAVRAARGEGARRAVRRGRAAALVACVAAGAMLTGCLTSSVDIPVSQASQLAQRKLTVGDDTEELREYQVTPIPAQAGWVFLRQPQRRDLVLAYSKYAAGVAPQEKLERPAALKGPVSVGERGSYLVLESATGNFIAPLDSVGMLRVTRPSVAKTAVFWTFAGPPMAAVAVAPIVLGVLLAVGLVSFYSALNQVGQSNFRYGEGP